MRWKRWALSPDEAALALDAVLRGKRPRIVAALVRRFGAENLGLAENALHDAGLRALERWPQDGVPGDPSAWLVRVAHNGLVDVLRREARSKPLPDAYDAPAEPIEPTLDDELRLVFLCCHPSLPRAAQLALTLRVACGLEVPQIARAFLSDERTITQRIVRAKQRLRDEAVRFELPEASELPARLAAMLDVIYLLFNEGYAPTEGEQAIDAALCDEALRLVRIVSSIPEVAVPAAHALRALLAFQASRAPARIADDGSLLLLPEQDRARWDPELIAEGFASLEASARGDALSRFHLEAAIAACHAASPSHAATDWGRIVELYEALRALSPSPIVEVNRALAVGMLAGARAGLDELDAIPERELIGGYPYALAIHAELHASLGELEEALAYLDRALAKQPSAPQRALLQRKRLALASRLARGV